MITKRSKQCTLLAILRNELYQSFRNNRDLEFGQMMKCMCKLKLHQAYRALHGNGEEEIWWEKKKQWRIVSAEEVQRELNRMSTSTIIKIVNN